MIFDVEGIPRIAIADIDYSGSESDDSNAPELISESESESYSSDNDSDVTAGAPAIHPICQGKGPKSNPTVGDDNEKDLEPMYMAIAEIRHSSSLCLNLSPFVTSYVSWTMLCTRTGF